MAKTIIFIDLTNDEEKDLSNTLICPNLCPRNEEKQEEDISDISYEDMQDYVRRVQKLFDSCVAAASAKAVAIGTGGPGINGLGNIEITIKRNSVTEPWYIRKLGD